MTHSLDRSTTFAPAGTVTLEPIALITPLSTTIVWSCSTVPFAGSITVPARTA